MVDDEVHDDPEPELMGLVEHLLKIIQRPVIRVDIPVIRDIVPVIRVRRRIDRAEPDTIHPQGLYVGQLFEDAGQIADAVPVAVLKASDPDLVK